MHIFEKCLSILTYLILYTYGKFSPMILHGLQFLHHTFSFPIKILNKGFLQIEHCGMTNHLTAIITFLFVKSSPVRHYQGRTSLTAQNILSYFANFRGEIISHKGWVPLFWG